MSVPRRVATLVTLVALTAGCAAAGTDAAEDQTSGASEAAGEHGADVSDDSAQRFPDVVDAELRASGDGMYEVAVTMSSPYDSPERYADGWRLLTPDGDVIAEHELAHDHANEQPFSRARGPFEIPEDVDRVTVEGHDLENGYGGETVTIDVPQ